MSNVKTNKLQTKDLVTIGIFSALYFAVNLGVMVFVGIAPILWLMQASILALLSGVIYMLLTTKVQKAGPVIIMSLITALIYVTIGECTWILLATYTVCGIIAELIRRGFGYQSFKGNLISYCIFSLGMIGSPLPMWIYHDSFFDSILKMGMDPVYVQKLTSMVYGWSLAAVIIGTIVSALIGGLIGKKMLTKHFKKAGII